MKLSYYTIPLTLSVYVQYDLPFTCINTLSSNLVESSSSLKWSLQQYFDVIQDSLHICRSKFEPIYLMKNKCVEADRRKYRNDFVF